MIKQRPVSSESKLKNLVLKELDDAIINLEEYFVERYFGKDAEHWWVASQLGETLFVNDFFFSLADMTDYIRNRYTGKEMIEHYELKLSHSLNNETFYNISSWKKLGKPKKMPARKHFGKVNSCDPQTNDTMIKILK